ncbi:MAG TPA: sigma-70 family RNA polymerase sigma factor [Armatimonadota bacterium]|jgi:RNA polymerase sigma factor (sigma-70 family)
MRPEALNALALRAQAGDQEATAAVLEALHRRLWSLAGEFHVASFTRADCYQEAVIGVLEGLPDYQPAPRARFSTFAYGRARGAILHALRDRGSLIRLPSWVQERYAQRDPEGTPLELRLVISLGPDEGGIPEPPDPLSPDLPRLLVLREALGHLTPQQRKVCETLAEGHSLSEAGRRLGHRGHYARNLATRIRNRALLVLTEVLK